MAVMVGLAVLGFASAASADFSVGFAGSAQDGYADLPCPAQAAVVGLATSSDASVEGLGPVCATLPLPGTTSRPNPVSYGTGTVHEDDCSAGEALVGIAGRVGAWLNQLQAVCRAIGSDGGATGETVALTAQGGNGGAPVSASCPGSQAAVAVRVVEDSADSHVAGVYLDCRALVYPPASTAPPAISGTARDGETLTATSGAWSGTEPISFTYQWRRCDADGGDCIDIGGATSSSYRATADDVGRRLVVHVTASNAGGSAGADSSASDAVGPVVDGAGGGDSGAGGSGGDQPQTVVCVVPRLVGKTLRSARKALRAAHCRLGKVTRKRTRRVKPGRVLRQRPAAHRRLPAGSKVAIVLSRR
jgi:hypothetical protein